MPEVLMIAAFFPPMGGAGVQRTLKFARYLPDFGWQPKVLTLKSHAGPADGSLLEELPVELPITRTGMLTLPRGLPWRLRLWINRWLLLVDEQVGWLPFAIPAGRRLLRGGAVQAIYSTSAPYTDHLVARSLHRHTRLPWVADFRDPWLENPLLKFPTSLHRRLNEDLERSIFQEATRVILNTESCCQRYAAKYPGLPAGKLVVIPNGYDQEDFAVLPHRLPPRPVFTIVHSGTLYQGSRSAAPFLQALQQAIGDGRIPAAKIHLQFIGALDKETRSRVVEHNLAGLVSLSGYVPHRQSIAMLNAADLLLLIPSQATGADLFIPAKAYEYLASHVPVLCLADPGGCAQLIQRARSGTVVSPVDINPITTELVRLYRLWEQGALHIEPDLDWIASFERRKLAGELASLLTEVTHEQA